MLWYLWKVQRICGEFLTDLPNDLPYILCCEWNFSPRVNMASNWLGCMYRVRRRETAPSLAALWLGRKKQRLSGIFDHFWILVSYNPCYGKYSVLGLWTWTFFSKIIIWCPILSKDRPWFSFQKEVTISELWCGMAACLVSVFNTIWSNFHFL